MTKILLLLFCMTAVVIFYSVFIFLNQQIFNLYELDSFHTRQKFDNFAILFKRLSQQLRYLKVQISAAQSKLVSDTSKDVIKEKRINAIKLLYQLPEIKKHFLSLHTASWNVLYLLRKQTCQGLVTMSLNQFQPRTCIFHRSTRSEINLLCVITKGTIYLNFTTVFSLSTIFAFRFLCIFGYSLRLNHIHKSLEEKSFLLPCEATLLANGHVQL